VGKHFADVLVEKETTTSKHHQSLRATGFETSEWARFLLFYRLHFSALASEHSLWLLSPIEVGIKRALDLTVMREWDEDDLFIPSFYKAAAAEGFFPCLPDVIGAAASLFVESNLVQLHVGHLPVRDSGGGQQVLTLGRHGSRLWLNDMRFHYSIQHLLSCETPWLFCRND
jgi:hypothetical protein